MLLAVWLRELQIKRLPMSSGAELCSGPYLKQVMVTNQLYC